MRKFPASRARRPCFEPKNSYAYLSLTVEMMLVKDFRHGTFSANEFRPKSCAPSADASFS